MIKKRVSGHGLAVVAERNDRIVAEISTSAHYLEQLSLALKAAVTHFKV